MASQERYKLFFINGSFILIVAVGCVLSINQTYSCGPGTNTPGYTVPSGDITLEYGENLDIMCVLHESKAEYYGNNPSSWMSIRMAGESQPIDIINSTAIKLHIEKHPKVDGAYYMCMINNTFICQNVVVVGTKPQNVTNFKCISNNYENLTCSWTAPNNYVKTDYYLEYLPSKTRSARTLSVCPKIEYRDGDRRKPFCKWSIFSGNSMYRHAHSNFVFFLVANNTFGRIQSNFTIDHFKHVIPSAPKDLTASATSPHSIKLKWLIPVAMQSFPGGITHRVMLYWSSGRNWTEAANFPDTRPNKRQMMEYELKDLPYAHYLYDIRVSIRSSMADKNDESMWSDNAAVTVWTQPEIPERPPKTDIGSFEIVNSITRYVYWQKIPEYEENGENFSYHIEVDGYPHIKPAQFPKPKPNQNYARFDNLPDRNYTFKIWSRNEIGLSREYSVVFIPSSAYAVKQPAKLIKVDQGHGLYDLEWIPSNDEKVINYTIFWCSDPKDRPYQCDGSLEWETVPNFKKHHSVEKRNQQINYQFAISANGAHTSSGMLWAECTVIPGRAVKLRQVFVKNVEPKSITVAWKLECVKLGDVTGFLISYCPTVPELTKSDCRENPKNETIQDSMVEEGTIHNLIPYTRYKIEIKPLINGSESYFSEPLLNSTFETAPSRPRDLTVSNISNSSISIQWKKPLDENGYLRFYSVYVNDRPEKNVTHVKGQDSFGINIPNLQSYTNYRIKVSACTTKCSEAMINTTTKVGRPGEIRGPSANYYDNATFVLRWDTPNPPSGKVDYYEVDVITHDKDGSWNGNLSENPVITVTEPKYVVDVCGKDKSSYILVTIRAVNILNQRPLKGPRSPRTRFPCSGVQVSMMSWWLVIILVASGVLLVSLVGWICKKFYENILYMKNVTVKLPDGLAAAVNYEEKEKHVDDSLPADEPLLSRKFPSQARTVSGESSGCSSGHESVASSVESAGHLSISDSGTEQPRSPSLGDGDNRDVALRQRVNKPNVKKSDYVTMPELSQTSWSPKSGPEGYSRFGVVSNKKPETSPKYMEPEYMEPVYISLSDIPSKSSYVPFSTPQTPELLKESTIIAPPSGYVPYMPQEPASKNTEYVMAGMPSKNIIAAPKQAFSQKEDSSGYVKAPPMETPKAMLQFPWQQAPVEHTATGYVVVGDTKPPKSDLDVQGGKGYVPHNLKFEAKSLKED